nr:hypothetical protein [Candidatus Sigynarchaeota archaeon]
MFKKRRIKKELDIALAEGDDAKVELLLKENPWLQDYAEDINDDTDVNLKRVCAAIGVMEDELGTPVPLDEILYSLENDFSGKATRSQLESICIELETKGYIKAQDDGYMLTVEGGRICDKYLNKQLHETIGELPGA